MPAPQQQQQQLVHAYSAPVAFDMHLHLLVQHVLLYWAVGLPDCTENLAKHCFSVVFAAFIIHSRATGPFERWLQQFMMQQQQQQQDEDQDGASGSSSLQQGSFSQQKQQLDATEAVIMREMLPVVLQLLRRAQAALEQGPNIPSPTPPAAAAGADVTAVRDQKSASSKAQGKIKPGNSSSSSSSSSRRWGVADSNGGCSGGGSNSHQSGSVSVDEGSYGQWQMTICQALMVFEAHCKGLAAAPAPAPPQAAAEGGNTAATNGAAVPAAAAAGTDTADAGAGAATAAAPGSMGAAAASSADAAGQSTVLAATNPHRKLERQLQQLATVLEPCARQQLAAAAAAAGGRGGQIDPEKMHSVMCSVSGVSSSNLQTDFGVLLKAAMHRGPGSKAARQLFGILSSLLKAGTALSSRGGSSSSSSSGGGGSGSNGSTAGGAVEWGPAIDQIAEQCRVTASLVIIALLLPSITSNNDDSNSSTSGEDDSSSSSSSKEATKFDPASKWRPADAAVLSPWLVLFGRCLVQWGRQLLSAHLGTLSHPFPCDPSRLAADYNILDGLSVFFSPVKAGGRLGQHLEGRTLFQMLLETVVVPLYPIDNSNFFSDCSCGDAAFRGSSRVYAVV